MNILFLIHNWIGYGSHGGTELHVKDIAEALKSSTEHKIYILFPDLRISRKTSTSIQQLSLSVLQLLDIRTHETKTITLNNPVAFEALQHDELTEIATELVKQYSIDIVHFFHLLHYPLNLPLAVKQAGAKVLISFFDHFFICPQFNLLKRNAIFCGYPNISLKTCDLCLKETFGYGAKTQETRRNFISQTLNCADAIHYLCNDQKSKVLAIYPHLCQKLDFVMGLGLEPASTFQELQCKQRDKNQPLKVACVGNFSYNKGADTLLQVIAYYLSQKIQDIEFHIYGNMQHPYGVILTRIAQKPGLQLNGAYTPEDLPELLKDCDVALFASNWPETFVLALSEVWSCGLVPIAPDIGAFSERITHGKNGLLYNRDDTGSIIDILDDLIRDRNKLEVLFNEIHQVEYPSLKDNVSEYLSLYQQMLDLKSEKLEETVKSPWTSWPVRWNKTDSQVVNTIFFDAPVSLPVRVWRFYKREGLSRTIAQVMGVLLEKFR